MNLYVKQTKTLSGCVTPPSSKSQSIRGIFLALLAEGDSYLQNILAATDTENAIQVCRDLGAQIALNSNTLHIKSAGLPLSNQTNTLVTGNSGITTHFVMPLLGLRKNPAQSIILDCGEQMRTRPIDSLVLALRKLGLRINYLKNEACLPLRISGELEGGTTEISGLTSQYLSALLLALPCAPKDSQITVKNLMERPYVEMTLQWLNEQKIIYSHEQRGDSDIYHIQGRQKYSALNRVIAADFSSASYLLAAGALIPGKIELKSLNMQDTQGDKKLVNILQAMGADIRIQKTSLVLHGGKPLTGLRIDASDIPDLLPTLAVLGTAAKGTTEIYNVAQARIKETDRIHSMTEGLRSLGAHIEEYADSIKVHSSSLNGARVKAYDDHRTVMALSLAGLLAEGLTIIDDAQAINKTFPEYVNTMKTLGALMEVR
jgi:3-phosphoshikimate 1-carboxyvinyltransferase